MMAVSVAAMGMGLFGALQNEARGTGGELQLHVKIPSIMERARYVHEFVRMERIRIVNLRVINYQLQMVHVLFSFAKERSY